MTVSMDEEAGPADPEAGSSAPSADCNIGLMRHCLSHSCKLACSALRALSSISVASPVMQRMACRPGCLTLVDCAGPARNSHSSQPNFVISLLQSPAKFCHVLYTSQSHKSKSHCKPGAMSAQESGTKQVYTGLTHRRLQKKLCRAKRNSASCSPCRTKATVKLQSVLLGVEEARRSPLGETLQLEKLLDTVSKAIGFAGRA